MKNDKKEQPYIINGAKLAREREKKLKKSLEKLQKKVEVVSILIGSDAPSVLYTGMKQKKAAEIGITFRPIRLAEHVSYKEVVDLVDDLNNDPAISGIMFQLPFPQLFTQANPAAQELIQRINPHKDMDGLTRKRLVLPAAVQAFISILHDETISVQGKKAVVLGASDLVGKPAGTALASLGALVEVCNSKTKNLHAKTRAADIIVCATGVPGILTADMVHDGVIVIDIGAEKVKGKVVGDVDFAGVAPKASIITPVPGGVGPMTVISLLENAVRLARK
jgi:methylenetetrahydrofolate dehydrogenase (NADP+)/methenyltetrahydrofolate cyclohydrolase